MKRHILTCPTDIEHKTFCAIAHVTQDWEVDRYGDYVSSLSVLETTHVPEIGEDLFHCLTCKQEAHFITEEIPVAEYCSLSPTKKHEWSASDAQVYTDKRSDTTNSCLVDVTCSYCGRSGSTKISNADIDW